MDPHPSYKSTSALEYITMISEATLATQGVASSSNNEKTITESDDATDNKVSGPATSLIKDLSTLPCLSSTLQGLEKTTLV